MDKIRSDPGSFKDPDGGILYSGDRVYRYFTPESSGKFRALNELGLLAFLSHKGLLIDSTPVSKPRLGNCAPQRQKVRYLSNIREYRLCLIAMNGAFRCLGPRR